MKTFLAQFTIYDGEHEHDNQFLLHAETLDQAWEIAEGQEHDTDFGDEDEDERAYWDYGDGTTRSKLKGVQEISEEDAQVLTRLSVAFYIDEAIVAVLIGGAQIKESSLTFGGTFYCLSCKSLADGKPATQAEVDTWILHPGWQVLCTGCDKVLSTPEEED